MSALGLSSNRLRDVRRSFHVLCDQLDKNDTAYQLGIRLIAIDRPGYGLSTDQPNRTFGDWSTDVLSVADALAIERFGVIGWSTGGIYGLTAAYHIPRLTGLDRKRLSCVAVVSADGPHALNSLVYSRYGAAHGPYPSERPIRLGRITPGPPFGVGQSELYARTLIKSQLFFCYRFPSLYRKAFGLVFTKSSADSRLLTTLTADTNSANHFMRALYEANRNGFGGLYRDLCLTHVPPPTSAAIASTDSSSDVWKSSIGFSLSEIDASLPIRLYHGGSDPAIHCAWSRYYAHQLSLRPSQNNTHLTIRNDLGHFSALNDMWSTILTDVAAPLKSKPAASSSAV